MLSNRRMLEISLRNFRLRGLEMYFRRLMTFTKDNTEAEANTRYNTVLIQENRSLARASIFFTKLRLRFFSIFLTSS